MPHHSFKKFIMLTEAKRSTYFHNAKSDTIVHNCSKIVFKNIMFSHCQIKKLSWILNLNPT